MQRDGNDKKLGEQRSKSRQCRRKKKNARKEGPNPELQNMQDAG